MDLSERKKQAFRAQLFSAGKDEGRFRLVIRGQMMALQGELPAQQLFPLYVLEQCFACIRNKFSSGCFLVVVPRRTF